MRLLLSTLLCAVLVSAQLSSSSTGAPRPTVSSTSTGIAASPTSTGSALPASPTTQSATGGKVCPGALMCISATVNSTSTLYELSAVSSKPGWMAIGFGSTMANTPMVILWTNSDGTVTLSQRQAPGEVEPSVVPTPPRVANADPTQAPAFAALPTFAFTIPTEQGTSQKLIWAFGTANPGSSAVDAVLQHHNPDGSGPVVLDVSQPLSASGTPVGVSASGTPAGTSGTPAGASGTPAATGAQLPLLSASQKYVVAHAVVFAVAFVALF